MKKRPNSFILLKIPLIYLATSLIWIFVGNKFLQSFTNGLSREALFYYQTCKGITYVGITGLMLFFLLKKQHKTLANSEEQYRNLFANNPNPMWVYDIHSRKFIAVNDAAIQKYGYSRQEFLKMTIYDIRPENNCENVDIAIESFKDNHKESGRWTHRKKTGEEFMVSITSHKVHFDNQDCTMVLAVDIDELVKNEKKLLDAYSIEKDLNQALENNNHILEAAYKRNSRWEDVLSKINNVVIILDKNGLITWANKAFTEVSGYTLEEALNKTPPDILAGENTDLSVVDELFKTIEKQHFFTCEMINYSKDKKEYWVEVNVSALLDDKGNFEGMISVESVITERKQKEEKIEAQNNALREIAWLSSHRFRRPVASILSLTEMLETANEDEREEYMSLLKMSTQELDEATHEISEKINHVESSSKI